jgi:type IV fimbrial biogenesis protein FimT
MHATTGRRRQRGVTLIELLVTMSIVVILLTVGVSGMSALVKRNTRVTEVNTMIGHLNFARAQAILRATDVRVCPVDPEHPEAGCSASADGSSWPDGYAIALVDGNDSTLEVLRLQEPIDNFSVDSGGRKGFEFKDDGTGIAGSIEFCDTRADAVVGAKIVVSRPGRVRKVEYDCSGGDDDDGDD